MMPHAQSSPASGAKMQTKLSAWTPLNNPRANRKVFEERRGLLAKWFDRWSESQRKAVLQDLVLSCSVEQLRFLSLSVSRRLPLQAADFTCLLPRALSLYLFSFLDPCSLCRCAQVSWHWKGIVELDQLWMPKCIKLGWSLKFSPKPFEQGIWKKHYIQTVQELRLSMLQSASLQQQFVVPDVVAATSRNHKEPTKTVAIRLEEHPASTKQETGTSFSTGLRKDLQPGAPPPWRDSDRHPKDTLRFNYLDNLDPIEQALRVQRNNRASTCCSNTSKPDDGKRKTLSEANYKLRKAKSLMDPTPHHSPPPAPSAGPHWTSNSQDYLVTAEAAESPLHLAHWNAGIRPRPVRTPVPRLSAEALRAFQRSHRSIPSTPLFEVQRQTVSASHGSKK